MGERKDKNHVIFPIMLDEVVLRGAELLCVQVFDNSVKQFDKRTKPSYILIFISLLIIHPVFFTGSLKTSQLVHILKMSCLQCLKLCAPAGGNSMGVNGGVSAPITNQHPGMLPDGMMHRTMMAQRYCTSLRLSGPGLI